MTTLIGFTGSLRHNSYNTAVLRALASIAPTGVDLVEFDVASIPFYNEDLEGDAQPSIIVALRRSVAEADGLVFVSPEYNGSMSAVTKNIIDWLSRPMGKGVIVGKKSMLVSATPGPGGGARLLDQQQSLLGFFGNTLVGVHSIAQVADKVMVSDGSCVITDESLRESLAQSLESF